MRQCRSSLTIPPTSYGISKLKGHPLAHLEKKARAGRPGKTPENEANIRGGGGKTVHVVFEYLF
jgi:hypothetical protein